MRWGASTRDGFHILKIQPRRVQRGMHEEGVVRVLLALLGDSYWLPGKLHDEVAELVRKQWSAGGILARGPMARREWRRLLDAGRWHSSEEATLEYLVDALFDMTNRMRPKDFCATKEV
jgi:hypothetical protein